MFQWHILKCRWIDLGLAGNRDWNMLCDAEGLDLLDSVILQQILQRVSNR